MFKNLNRGISMPIAIGIIAVLVVVVGGGILAYQYYYVPQQSPENQQVQNQNNQNFNQTPPTTQYDFLKLDKDVLLHKLFPNIFFENGVGDLVSAGETYPGLNLYLKDSVEDYFINNQEKNLLLVVQLDGVAHAGGLYHSYLGLFDKNGNLLTPFSIFPKSNVDNPYGDDYYDFLQDKAQFGADTGEFGFYDCKGTKYILFVSSGCPNGSCCDASAKLFRISNGNFETLQTINNQSLAELETKFLSIILPVVNAATGPSYGLKMILSGDKILIKKVPAISDNGCQETNYKELKWDKNTCRFK